MNGAWPPVLAAGCLLLVVVVTAVAGSPGAVQPDNILVSTGGDSFGTLLDPAPAGGISTSTQPPPWTGLLVLVVGSLISVLWLGIVVLAVLNQAGTDRDSGDQRTARPSPERREEKREGLERRRRPSPHPSDWL